MMEQTKQTFAAGDVTLSGNLVLGKNFGNSAATAAAMLLAYYDVNGYMVNSMKYSMDHLIAGTVTGNRSQSESEAQGSTLGTVTVSDSHFSRYVGTTSTAEYQYTFAGTSGELDKSSWSSISDYIGADQFWRGNADGTVLSVPDAELGWLRSTTQSITVSDGGKSEQLVLGDVDFLCGLANYIEVTSGYVIDESWSGTFVADTMAGGMFGFEYLVEEIDCGRGVLLHMQGEVYLAYGYNQATNSVIFDDTRNGSQQLVWGQSCTIDGVSRSIDAVTVLAFDAMSLGGQIGRPTVSLSTTAWTNQPLTISVVWAAGAAKREYSLDKGRTWTVLSGDTLTVSANGEVRFRNSTSDNHYAITSLTVSNIDTTAPTLSAIATSTTAPGVSSVTLTISGSDDSSGLTTIWYSYDNVFIENGVDADREKHWFRYDGGLELQGNSQVFFRAQDAAGNFSAATSTVVQNIALARPRRVLSDFDGNGRSDIFFTGPAGTSAWTWFFSGTTGGAVDNQEIGMPPPGAEPVGIGDFRNDGRSDILWKGDSGYLLWENGTTTTSTLNMPSASYAMRGVGDFNGDGGDDLLMQNGNEIGYWDLSDGSWTALGNARENSSIVGVGDLDGDGNEDIVWLDGDSLAIGAWVNNSAEYHYQETAKEGWDCIGVADVQGYGREASFWFNPTTMEVGAWVTHQTGNDRVWLTFGASPNSGWEAVGVGDYDGNGLADILWHNTQGDGSMGTWMNVGAESGEWNWAGPPFQHKPHASIAG